MATLTQSQGSAASISADLMRTYLLALDQQSAAAQVAMLDLRKRALQRYPDGHPVYKTMDFIDALIDGPVAADAARRDLRQAKALTALEASTGRKVRLPLAPNWFAF